MGFWPNRSFSFNKGFILAFPEKISKVSSGMMVHRVP